jgi:predicted dehydrogenase/NADPH:quinone reductase-like Zn-dependent oxidoreductase
MGRLQSMAASAQHAVSAELYRAGYTPKSLEETQRDVLWWVYARAQAALNLRPLFLNGWGIAWTSAGYAELVPVEVPKAGRDRVTVRVLVSSVSPGTERAQYLKLPNAQVGLLGRPGYSAAGTVISAGGKAAGLTPGDLVAVTGAAHASVVNAPAAHVFRVPRGVSPEHASLVMLGTICLNGADLAAAQPGESVAVVGAGPIGILALRLACREATPVAVLAASRRGTDAARRSGAPLLSVEEDAEKIRQLGADVVIEATGDPQGIHSAVAAAGQAGRIILLGSARGVTRDLPVDEIRRKRLRLVGAHVDTLDLRAGTPDGARRAAGERFLELLAAGQLEVADLVGPAVDPRRAAAFYRDLAEGRHGGGAHFDWRQLPPAEAIRPGHLLRPPNALGRGMDSTRPIRPRRPRTGGWLGPSDPFSGAAGRLRLGLIGCGDIAVHNAAGAAAAPNVEVVACYDPVLRLAEDLATRHGARALASQEEILAASDIDAVVLSVPHDLHAPLAIEACRAGKNVVVEKPLASDLEWAVAMARAAVESGVWLSACFPQRYEPKVQVARRLIEQGALGELQGTLIQLLLDKSPAYWHGGFSGRAQSDWRRLRQRAGGGVLIMNLSHHLDLMRYLSGMEVETVLAQADPVDAIEELVTASLRYAGGALGSLLGSSNTRGSTEEALTLWGADGRLVLEPEARVYTLQAIPGLRTTRWHSFGRLPSVNIRAVYFSRLATAVSEGRGPEVTAADGVAVQAIIEAIYRSATEQAAASPAELTDEVRQSEPAIA